MKLSLHKKSRSYGWHGLGHPSKLNRDHVIEIGFEDSPRVAQGGSGNFLPQNMTMVCESAHTSSEIISEAKHGVPISALRG